MKIVVTGGAGFIGGHLVERLLSDGHEVLVLDNLDPQVHPRGYWPKFLRLHPRGEYVHNLKDQHYRGNRAIGLPCEPVGDSPALHLVKCDIIDDFQLDMSIGTFQPDAVIHLAAAVGVGQSATEEYHYMKVNAGGTASVLQAARQAGTVKRVIVASSMSCYGEGRLLQRGTFGINMPAPFRTKAGLMDGNWEENYYGGESAVTAETQPLRPTSIYAESKATTERMSLIWGDQNNIPVAAMRFFNVYGSRQSLSNPYTGVAAIFTSCYLRGEAPVIYEDGLQSRDFVHVDDVVSGIITMLGNDYHGPVNVCTGVRTTIKRLAESIGEALFDGEIPEDLKPKITGKYRIGDIRHCIGRSALLESFGWKPRLRLNMESGISALTDWARSFKKEDIRMPAEDPHRELEEVGMLLQAKQ